MADVRNREIVERCAHALEAKDFDAQALLIAEDYVEGMPQSGERIRAQLSDS